MKIKRVGRYSTLLMVVALFGSLHCVTAHAQSPVSREKLEQMFANIAQKTKWDMSRDMLWGYFFTHSSRGALDDAALELSRMGYRVVSVYPTDKKKAFGAAVWWLHVERIETHTVDSLDRRNADLAKFATARGLASYDGMDVGQVDNSVKK